MKICTTLFIALALAALALWRTDFFSLERISLPLIAAADPLPSVQVPSGTYRYLSRGRQMFAFESENGQYVLKFFNRAEFESPFISTPKAERYRQGRMQIYPESYRLSLEKMSAETGVVAVHQGISSVNFPTVELIDKASRRFTVDLNRVPFVLQKKGEGRLLERLQAELGKPKFDRLIDQFFAIHAKRIGQRIADGDRDIKRNYAWQGDRLLYIDPARFSYDPDLHSEAKLRREWWKVTYRLRRWLAKNAPEKLESFDARIEMLLDEASL